jgi:hypothetical protein
MVALLGGWESKLPLRAKKSEPEKNTRLAHSFLYLSVEAKRDD